MLDPFMGAPFRFHYSEGRDDPSWDEFLARADGGRHEQTCRWGRVKAQDGWRPVLCVAREREEIAGGFLLLWRVTRLGIRVGYVSHGPVIDSARPRAADSVVEELLRTCGHMRLTMAIIHPPACRVQALPLLLQRGCLRNWIYPVAEATAEIDLTRDPDNLLGQLRGDRRRNIRRSLKSGFSFREGTAGELDQFFQLMRETCRRQNTSPNPASAALLHTLWEQFHPSGQLRLFLVDAGGAPICGALMFLFGRRAMLWKIGWSGACRKWSPNDFMHWQLLLWARREGFLVFDFLSVDPVAASEIENRQPGAKRHERSPTFYKMGFRPRVVRFPPSQIYVPKRLLRTAYRTLLPLLRGYRSPAC